MPKVAGRKLLYLIQHSLPTDVSVLINQKKIRIQESKIRQFFS